MVRCQASSWRRPLRRLRPTCTRQFWSSPTPRVPCRSPNSAASSVDFTSHSSPPIPFLQRSLSQGAWLKPKLKHKPEPGVCKLQTANCKLRRPSSLPVPSTSPAKLSRCSGLPEPADGPDGLRAADRWEQRRLDKGRRIHTTSPHPSPPASRSADRDGKDLAFQPAIARPTEPARESADVSATDSPSRGRNRSAGRPQNRRGIRP